MIPASKSTLNLKNLEILRTKGTKNLTNFRKKFCESPPSALSNIMVVSYVWKLGFRIFWSTAIYIYFMENPKFVIVITEAPNLHSDFMYQVWYILKHGYNNYEYN